MRARALILGAWLAQICAACGLPPDEAPAGSTSTSTSTEGSGSAGGVTGYLEPRPCQGTAECENGHCIAPFDPGAQPPIGEPICLPKCLEAGVLERACVDDASCCTGLSCNSQRFCVDPEAGTGTDTGTDTGGESTGTTGDTTGG